MCSFGEISSELFLLHFIGQNYVIWLPPAAGEFRKQVISAWHNATSKKTKVMHVG